MRWRDHVNVIGQQFFAAFRLRDIHIGIALNQLRHQRFVSRIQMLDDDKRHARWFRIAAEQFA